MGDKCEWKDGKFEGCKIGKEWDRHVVDFNGEGLAKKVIACPFCGADIRKPEPAEPLIVKSGETWVAHWEGVDYLCVDPNYYSPITIRPDLFAEILNDHPDHWKSFTGPDPDITELTDEIAKLRPMVQAKAHINNCFVLSKLIYVNENKYHTDLYICDICRLATAHELQESE